MQRRAVAERNEAQQRRGQVGLKRVVLNLVVLRLLRVPAGRGAQHRIGIHRIRRRDARQDVSDGIRRRIVVGKQNAVGAVGMDRLNRRSGRAVNRAVECRRTAERTRCSAAAAERRSAGASPGLRRTRAAPRRTKSSSPGLFVSASPYVSFSKRTAGLIYQRSFGRHWSLSEALVIFGTTALMSALLPRYVRSIDAPATQAGAFDGSSPSAQGSWPVERSIRIAESP